MLYRQADSTRGLTGLSTFIGFIEIINNYSSESRYEEAVKDAGRSRFMVPLPVVSPPEVGHGRGPKNGVRSEPLGSCNQNVGVPPMVVWCLAGTVYAMAMTLRLTEDEQDALRRRAALDGTSMQDVARRAVREYVARAEHRDRVASAA